MMRNKGNLVSATCLAVFGVYVISVASKLAYVSEVGPGPGSFRSGSASAWCFAQLA